jgi:hypothetical protein
MMSDNLYVVAIALPVLSLLALGLWIWVKYPAIEEGVGAEELDTLSDELPGFWPCTCTRCVPVCKYHPKVRLTDAFDGETPTPCIECWNDYRYPKEEV